MSHDFSSEFPARKLTTTLAKDDLNLPRQTQNQIEEIGTRIVNDGAMPGVRGASKTPNLGYRVHFHGPPGTGKTLAATVLGQSIGREVYRVALSEVVSKYIGETEKNLSRVFDEAEKNGWILFFDEADALFGKRTETSSAHDRYANLEVSHLLQRIETSSAVIILATNLRSDIDSALERQFESMVAFTHPNNDERKRL